MERALVRGLTAVRVAQFAPFGFIVLAGNTDAYRRPGLVVGLYLIGVAWSVALFAHGLRRHWFGTPWIIADVVFMSAAMAMVGEASLPGRSTTWDNWTTGPATGAAVLVVIYSGRWLAGTSLAVLAAGYLMGTWGDLEAVGGLASITGNLASITGFSIAGGLLAGALRASARRTDELAQVALEAQRAEATMRARMQERTRQYRMLHDTVLSTLSAISRGGLDHRKVEVQERCAKDAAYLRGLITGGADDAPTSLGAALSAVIRDQAAFDLDVQPHFDTLPTDVPDDVVQAIAFAVREALNNVAKHAATKRAWLTATGGEGGALAVSVTDRGVGVDLARVKAKSGNGLGIDGSIRARLREIGATAVIHSAPGEGTTVEIRWPT